MDAPVLGLGWKRADGVITQVLLPPGPPYESGLVRYAGCAAFTLGAEGTMSQGLMVPDRSDPPDSLLERPAQVNHPCTYTISPSGEVKMFVYTEVWAVEDCV